MRRKFFVTSRAPVSRFQKLSFDGYLLKKVLWRGLNLQKSPCAHVCDRSDRSKRRKTFPFALANYKLSKEHLENKQWALAIRRKVFVVSRSPVSRFEKLSFGGYLLKKCSEGIWTSKNHHVRTFATVVIDLSVVPSSRLLWRTTIVSKIISNTYNGS